MSHRRRLQRPSNLPRSGRWVAAAAGIAATVALAGGSGRAADPCTIAWDGGAGTAQWTDAANWTGDRLPAASDEVCIGAGFDVTLGGIRDQNAGGIRVDGSLTLEQGLILAGPQASEVNGTLTIDQGRLQLNGDLPVASLRQKGGIVYGSGSITTPDFVWTGGRMRGDGTTEVLSGGPGLTMAGDLHALDDNRVLRIDPGAQATWTAGDIDLRTDSQLDNAGLLEVRGDQDFGGCCGNTANVLNEPGATIRRSDGDGTLALPYYFANDGTLDLQTGTLELTSGNPSGHASKGTFDVADGAALLISQGDTGFASSSSVVTHGSGLVRITGGQARFAGSVDARVDIDGPVAFGFFESQTTVQRIRVLNGGTLGGSARVTTPDLVWEKGRMTNDGTTAIAPGGEGLTLPTDDARELDGRTLEIEPDAEMTWSAGDLLAAENARIENHGLLDLTGDVSLTTCCGFPTIDNEGTLRKSGGDGIAALAPQLLNTGTIEARSGNLDLAGGLTNIQDDRLDGGRYVVSATLSVNGGYVRTNAADIELDGPASSFEDDGGSDALRDLASNIDGGRLTLAGGRSLAPSGDLANDSTVVLGDGATLAPAGGYDQSGGETDFAGDGATIRPGSIAHIGSGLLSGSGTVDGTLANDGGVVDPGIATLDVTGDYSQGPDGTLAATIAGPAVHTTLDVRGHAQLAGELALTTIAYEPSPTDEIELIRHGSEDGEFGSVTGLEPDPGHSYSPPDYGPDGVWLRPGTTPTATIGAATAAEADPVATFEVTLDRTATRTVRIGWHTADGTATAGSDYDAASGTVTIPHGHDSARIDVPLRDDTADEPDETFTVELDSPENATLAGATGTATILDDDEPAQHEPPPGGDHNPPPPPHHPPPKHRPPRKHRRPRCVDRRAPRSHLLKHRHGIRFRHRRLRLHGRARDRGCSHLHRVSVAVALHRRHHRCRFLTRIGRLAKPSPCGRPRFVPVRGLRRWHLRTRRRLPRGRYTVRSRATDRAGNRERRRGRANFRRVRLR